MNKQNKLIIILIVLVVMVLGFYVYKNGAIQGFIGNRNFSDEVPKNFIEVKNNKNGISVKYPPDWKLYNFENDTSNPINISKIENNMSIEVTIYRAFICHKKCSLEESKKIEIQSIKQSLAANSIEQGYIKINGYSGYKILYKYGKKEVMRVAFIKDDKIYSAQYDAEVEIFDNYIETAKQIIGSINII